jgi:CheY-like chemotaxis protein
VIANQLIHLMKGKLKVKSHVNGSVILFHISFPTVLSNSISTIDIKNISGIFPVIGYGLYPKLQSIIKKYCDYLGLNSRFISSEEDISSIEISNNIFIIPDTLEKTFQIPLGSEIITICRQESSPTSITYPISIKKLYSALTYLKGLRLRYSSDLEKGKQKTVLVAEDHLVNNKMVVRMLGQLGHLTESAFNGVEAVEKAKAKKYDLILMVKLSTSKLKLWIITNLILFMYYFLYYLL